MPFSRALMALGYITGLGGLGTLRAWILVKGVGFAGFWLIRLLAETLKPMQLHALWSSKT